MATVQDTSGRQFTQKIHSKAEGPTDPANNKLPSSFVAAVTGAGKGLGYHISLAYARAGAAGLAISSRTQSDLDKLSKAIHDIDPNIKVLATVTDTTKSSDIQDLVKQVEETFGRVDAVIANAGIISKYIFDEDDTNRRLPWGVEDDDFDRVITINLLGSQKTARYFLPLLSKTKGGPQALIFITSLASHSSDSSYCPPAYNLSKRAMNHLAEHMHNDYNSSHGITAYAVHPGAVLTPQTELHSVGKGDKWDEVLTDDEGLCGGFLTWLTKEKRDWLSGRYLSVTWDVEELEAQNSDIVKSDKLKFRMAV